MVFSIPVKLYRAGIRCFVISRSPVQIRASAPLNQGLSPLLPAVPPSRATPGTRGRRQPCGPTDSTAERSCRSRAAACSLSVRDRRPGSDGGGRDGPGRNDTLPVGHGDRGTSPRQRMGWSAARSALPRKDLASPTPIRTNQLWIRAIQRRRPLSSFLFVRSVRRSARIAREGGASSSGEESFRKNRTNPRWIRTNQGRRRENRLCIARSASPLPRRGCRDANLNVDAAGGVRSR
jgi:hypothetical protein